jgi:uncharacterized protein
MVTRSAAWPEGTPCWVDLGVDDVAQAIEFYSGLFGWQAEIGPPETGGYAMCRKDGKSAAGIGQRQNKDVPIVWTTYLAVDDVDKSTSKVTEAGGHVLAEPFDVVDFGRMSFVADPTGAAFGMWQTNKHIGAEIANEDSTLSWNELNTRDLDGAKAFYGAVFGYTYDEVPGPYAMLKVNGATAGGMGPMAPGTPDEVPAHWLTYFQVANTDAAVAKVGELGGNVIAPAVDTEYGRIAIVTDNQGAMFALIQGA